MILFVVQLIQPLEVLAYENEELQYPDVSIKEINIYGPKEGDNNGGYINDGYEPDLPVKSRISLLTTETLPSAYTSPYVTSIKSQGSYGTCWTFSSIALMETSAWKNGIATSPDYSESHLGYCVYNRKDINDPLGNTYGDYRVIYEDWRHRGGNANMAGMTLLNWEGTVDESRYPYAYVGSEVTAADFYLSNLKNQNLDSN